MSVYRRHHEVVQAIERTCRVAEWRAGDIDLWPLASQDLFQEMFRNGGRETAQPRASFAIRAATTVAVPAANLWKGRHSLPDLVSRPHRADAILLGDGVSLDMVDGSWRDRFGEPVVAALERHGLSTFVMQPGNLTRLPWLRPTYPANQIAARAAIIAALAQGPKPQLPDHADVMGLVEDAAEPASSLSAERLKRRAGVVAAQAAAFERILRRVRPKVVFVVTYYAGLGHVAGLPAARCPLCRSAALSLRRDPPRVSLVDPAALRLFHIARDVLDLDVERRGEHRALGSRKSLAQSNCWRAYPDC
jgi:hypothetical protein